MLMPTATIETELVELEKEYWQSMKDKDVETAVRLSADPCILTGAQGVSRIDHATYKKLMTNANWSLLDFEFADVQTQQITEDVVVVAYKVTERLTVDGKPVTLVANDSTTWVRRDGQWLCAVHTEAVAGDPYGRDRKPSA
jgi:hypothetical protein